MAIENLPNPIKLPVMGAPTPLTNIVPFTERDGTNYLRTLAQLIDFLNRIIDLINQSDEDFYAAIRADMKSLRDDVQAALDAQWNLTTEINENTLAELEKVRDELAKAVEQVINSSIEVSDPLMVQILNSAASGTRKFLDERYALATNVVKSVNGRQGALELTPSDVKATVMPLPDTIPLRSSTGALPGIAAPTSDTHGANKKYVDDSMLGGGGVNPANYGVPVDGTTRADTQFKAMLNALPAGAVVQARPGQAFKFDAPVEIAKVVTIRGGRFAANRTGPTFVIDSDDVTIDGATINGPGASLGVVLDQRFITTKGTSQRPIRRAHIANCFMSGCQSSFMWLDWLEDFTIENNQLTEGQYGGIMMLSPKRGTVRNNIIRTLLQGDTLVNSYGIAATDNDNTAAARAEDVLIDGNYVSDVPGWKGIDSHGGKRIQAVNNRVRGCRTGISFTTGNDTRLMPPEDCLIANNIIELGSPPTQNAAIVLNGASASKLATGAIGTNVILGFVKDLDLQFYPRDRVSVAPQLHNGTTKRTPGQPPFRTYAAQTVVTKPAGTANGSQVVNFPAGYFTTAPVVQATKATGTGALFIPFVENVTAESATISLYHAQGITTSSYEIAVNVVAIQTGSGGNGAAWV